MQSNLAGKKEEKVEGGGTFFVRETKKLRKTGQLMLKGVIQFVQIWKWML